MDDDVVSVVTTGKATHEPITTESLCSLLQHTLLRSKKKLLATIGNRYAIKQQYIELYDLGESHVVQSIFTSALVIKFLSKTTIVIGSQNTLKIWDLYNNTMTKAVPHNIQSYYRILVLGNYVLCSPTSGDTFCVWNTVTDELHFPKHTGLVSVGVLDNNRLVSCSKSYSTLCVWDIHTMKCTSTDYFNLNTISTMIPFDHETVIVTSKTTLNFFNWEQGTVVKRIDTQVDRKFESVESIVKIDSNRFVILHKEDILYGDSDYYTLSVWNMSRNKCECVVYTMYETTVDYAHYAVRDNMLYYVHKNYVCEHDLRTHKLVRKIPGKETSISSMTIW